MRRIWATFRRDFLLQVRYRLVAVSVFLVVIFGVILYFVPVDLSAHAALAVPVFITTNLMITTLYFMAAMVLLEKGEGMLSATVTTPLRPGEYLLSKALSLALLAAAESLLLVIFIFGWQANWLLLVGGVLVLGLLYALMGFVVISRYDSITDFLMPSVLLVTVLALPILSHFGLVSQWAFAWNPVLPAYILLRGAYTVLPVFDLTIATVGLLSWTGVFYMLAIRQFTRFVVREAGG